MGHEEITRVNVMAEAPGVRKPFRVERCDIGARVVLVVLDEKHQMVMRGEGASVDEAFAHVQSRATAALGAIQQFARDGDVGRLTTKAATSAPATAERIPKARAAGA